MNSLGIFILFISAFSTVDCVVAAPVSFSSPVQQATLIELYTSEGCSSCPPADSWLSQFKDNEHLWTQIVPVSFHVDYWDNLGWRDRFSSAEFSRRQISTSNITILMSSIRPVS